MKIREVNYKNKKEYFDDLQDWVISNLYRCLYEKRRVSTEHNWFDFTLPNDFNEGKYIIKFKDGNLHNGNDVEGIIQDTVEYAGFNVIVWFGTKCVKVSAALNDDRTKDDTLELLMRMWESLKGKK